MPVQAILIPAPVRLDLHFRNLLDVLLVVDAIPQHIPEIAQRALQSIRRPLLLRLLKRLGLARVVLDMPVPDILVERAIAQRHAHNDAQPQRDLERLRVLVDKVNLDLLDLAAPAVEAEHLVRERDALLGRHVPYFLAAGTAARGQVLWPELLFEARLEGRDFLRGVLGDVALGLGERVCEGRRVLVAWAIERESMYVRVARRIASKEAAASGRCTARGEGLTQAL